MADAAGAIVQLPDRHRPAHTGNKGELARGQAIRLAARGQAQAGFPHVVQRGLPTLRARPTRGDAKTTARVNALLAIMAGLDDTCVLARAGRGRAGPRC